MPDFLYRIQPTRLGMLIESTPEENAIVSEHFYYLRDLHQKGIATFVGRVMTTDERSFGIAVFHVDSEEEAHRLAANDPAIQKGVMRVEILPFKVVFS